MGKNIGKRILSVILSLVMALSMAPVTGFAATADVKSAATGKVTVPDDRIYITSSKYNLVSGATEMVLTTNNVSGNNQRIGYFLNVDKDSFYGESSNIKIVACYKDYQYETFGLQTVTDQAKAYEKANPGETVIAGINACFYNMATGEPSGAFVMNGNIYKEVDGSPYFAILKDGTAVIRNGSQKDLSDVQEAVAGNMQILTNGEVTVAEGDYQTLSYSRTAVGVTKDGDVMTYVTHGISVPTSCGETYVDVAKIMLSQGCYNAVMLDGGGSTTYASMHEGTDKLVVQNNPSDGTPRTVSNTLLFVSTAESDGEFNHASISPNNAYYTPSTKDAVTTVQLEAVGIDSSGAACNLPEGLVWSLTEESKEMGSINAETGLFTAAEGKTGTVEVQLLNGEAVAGSTEFQLTEPEELYFSGKAISLDFSAKSTLGLNVRGQGVDLIFKDGDFTWDIISKTDGISNEQIGSVTNNVFTSGGKQSTALEGTVKVRYKKLDNTELTASIDVEIGKMPIVKLDFENVDTNSRGKDVVALWDWGATASFFTDAGGVNQEYTFQNYHTLYYLQSTTYASDSLWINERYITDDQPWIENEDGSITCFFEDKEYPGVKEAGYGISGDKWVSFTDDKGASYYWRVHQEKSGVTGNFNASKSASAIFGADGYEMYVWHTSANPSTLASGKLHGAGSQIVDSSDGEVRFGKNALKLTYDFRNFSPTGSTKNCNTYYRMTNPLVADGSPSGLGMWVYAPEGMSNFWFWTQVTYWNGTKWADAYIHFKPSGAEKNCQYTGVNWTGWTYVEADLSAVYGAGAVVDEEHPIQIRSGNPLILLTYIPGGTSDGEGHAIVCGSKTEGYFYIDNVRFVYGTNVDDMDSPQIISAKANGKELSVKNAASVDTNDVSFEVDFTDPQGENYSGIDITATQLFLDGTVLSSNEFVASSDRAQTSTLQLANGEHTLKVSICDNFGNRTEQTYSFIVENPNTTIPVVSIERNKEAELGADYEVVIKADDLKNIASVSTNIIYENVEKLETVKKELSNGSFYDDYGNLLTKGEDGNYYDENGNLVDEPMRPNAAGSYSISSAVQMLGENLTGKVRNKLANSSTRSFTAEATVKDEISNNNTLLIFKLPVPHTLSDVDKVPVTITVTYKTKDGAVYTVTSGKENHSIYAYYNLNPGIQIAGAGDGTIAINTVEGGSVSVENLKVYVNADTEIAGTFVENEFTTDYFVKQEAGTVNDKVWVGDAENQHYSFYTIVNVVGSAFGAYPAYDVTLNATTGDPETTQQITWFRGADTKTSNAIVQYMTAAAYKEAYDAAYAEAESALPDPADGEETVSVDADAVNEKVFADAKEALGTAKLTKFDADNKAAYINNVTIQGLTPGTDYVCRAGDGNGWSKVTEFSTLSRDGSTRFAVIADAQLLGDDEKDAEAIAILNNMGKKLNSVDFGIQTGDFVDGGIEYRLWDQILGVWGDSFPGIDFAHVMGNHETYGTAGSTITPLLFGLNSSEKDYYSVEYGDVYVAVINQTADLEAAAEWLVEDAAKTDCIWKVLTSHQPVYYTNPNGSSEGHNKILAPACDKAGIDFVFNGHDHSYARTEQIKNRTPVALEVDEATNAYIDANGDFAATKGQGTVYFICGDLGEKSREDAYRTVDNPDFHFAKISQNYSSLYLTVDATKNKMTVTAWNLSGTEASVLDTYTMYTGEGACESADSHVIPQDIVKYNAESGKLICDRCKAEIAPSDIMYTGYAVDMNGVDEYGDSQYYFLAGSLKTDFFAMGEKFLYANEVGLIDHKTENYVTNTCTESGNHMAYSPRYDRTYKGGIAKYTGHDYAEQEDGSLKCSICDHSAIDVADWNFSLSYTSATYTGTAKQPAVIIQNPETGEKLEFHVDGEGKLTDFSRLWKDNRNVGTAVVSVEMNPKGDYTNSRGSVVLTLKICPAEPVNVVVTGTTSTTADLSWEPAKQATGYKVYYKNGNVWKLLGTTDTTSYTAVGLNSNTEYEFAVRSFTEKEDGVYNSLKYSASVKAVTAAEKDINETNVKLSFTKATYSGTSKRPAPTVTDAEGNILVKNTDYKVIWGENINVGTGTVSIIGLGVYSGEKIVEFAINQQKLNADLANVTAEDTDFAGEGTTTSLSVKDNNGRIMVEGTDYSVAYTDNSSTGVASITVTGKGNYSGSITGKFTINPANISEMVGKVDPESDLTYTGAEMKPAVLISGLEEGTDYTVSYKNNVNAGMAEATVTGIGNYTGILKVIFTIEPVSIKNAVISDSSTYSYTGEAIEADLNIAGSNGQILELDKDYIITGYENNTECGTAAVYIEGIGNYKDTVKHEFIIQSTDIQSFTVNLDPDTFVFTGGSKVPVITVTDGSNKTLVPDKDYTVEITDNRNAGLATVTITGIGNYAGIVVKNFTIEPADLKKCTVQLSYTTTTFSGSLKTPGVVVKTEKGTTLKKDVNYKVTYENNKEAGTASAIITGMGNYSGTVIQNFTINPADLSKGTIILETNSVYADGSEQRPNVEIRTAKGTGLREGQHYELTYKNNVEAGTAEVIATGINSYAGELRTTFTIYAPKDISNYSAKLSYTRLSYTGDERCPSVTLKTPAGTILKKGTNYKVEYKNNINIGVATVVITGIGKYCGTITKTFSICPVKPSNVAIESVSATTAKITFTRNECADKYYIYVDGVYNGCAKTVNYYTIKNLESGKTYNVTVKAVTVVDGKNYYSSASSLVTVTTK